MSPFQGAHPDYLTGTVVLSSLEPCSVFLGICGLFIFRCLSPSLKHKCHKERNSYLISKAIVYLLNGIRYLQRERGSVRRDSQPSYSVWPLLSPCHGQES